MRQLNVAIIGCGTVGGGVWQALRRNQDLLEKRAGIRLRVSCIVVKDPDKKRFVRLPKRLVGSDWKVAVDDPKTDLVVELVGGVATARKVVEKALGLGKPVVTANKALLAAHGDSLFEKAKNRQTGLYFEASVAGGIPIVKVLREGLLANRFPRIYGILNGTCNYILSRMQEEGEDFSSILAEAQLNGYAESDASLDVNGLDALHKTAILASLAHGFWVSPGDIHVEGIRHVTNLDIGFADRLGYRIKLLSSILSRKQDRDVTEIQATVCPTLIPHNHGLADIDGVFNAINVHGDIVGETLYCGQGAGAEATASAVLSDIAAAALDSLKLADGTAEPTAPCSGCQWQPFTALTQNGKVIAWEDVVSKFYLRLTVTDAPGTMAQIANVLAENAIGISSIIQPEGHKSSSVPLILMIHDASVRAMNQALKQIRNLSVVKAAPVMIRVDHFQ